MRFSPVPATLTSASSRSSGLSWLRCRASDGEIGDAVHRDQPVELVPDLLQHRARAGRHDGDARQVLLVLRLRYGEALDVVAAAGEKPDDAREHARLVVDEHGERMRLLRVVPILHEVGGGGRGERGRSVRRGVMA